MTHSRVVLWVAALWVTALALSGCLFTGHEDTIKTPPLRLRSAVPADSVESVADSEGFFTASLSFNRSVGADELRLKNPVRLDEERREGRSPFRIDRFGDGRRGGSGSGGNCP